MMLSLIIVDIIVGIIIFLSIVKNQGAIIPKENENEHYIYEHV